VVGYSRLLGADEAGTLERLRAVRCDVVDPLLREHGGRVFKTTGDGLLAEFSSAVQALRCAIAIQSRLRANASALQLRIGLHQGDVIIVGDDLLGDGVNIAARIEPLAEPGGIAISARVREDAAGKISFAVEDLGEPDLKNITQKVRIFRVRLAAPERPALPLPDKPSLAVLPFQNMSGDAEQEYFVDGLVEDITTALSRAGGLFVIARNSAFTYKGRAVDVRAVGRELGVRYVLEGSVRRAAGRVRITGQLIEAMNGGHIWADRFEGDLADIFDLQDSITARVVAAIEPSVERAEALRASSKPTYSLDAYDRYLRAVLHFHARTKPSLDQAVAFLRDALEHDSEYALAKGFLAYLLTVRDAFGWGAPDERDSAVALVREVFAAAPDDPLIARWIAHPLVYFVGDFDRALLILRQAEKLTPHSAQLLRTAGLVHSMRCEPAEAIDYHQRAIRLSPVDPEMPMMQMEYGMALVIAGNDEEALRLLNQAVTQLPDLAPAYRFMIIALWRLNRIDEMRATAGRLMKADPAFRISTHVRPFREKDFLSLYERALRAAAVPE